MSELELVAALVRALAWPLAFLVVVLLLRPALVELLGRQGLRRLKAGPLEAEWERERERTQAELGAGALTGPVPVVHGHLSEELGELARRAPSVTVLEAYARVERELRRLLKGSEVHDVEQLGGIRLARLAADRGLISPASARAVEGVAVMRNLVAHDQVQTGEQEAREYLALADGVLYGLRHRPSQRARPGEAA